MKQIPLNNGYTVLVDDEDYDRVSQYKWYATIKTNTVYAQRNSRHDERPGQPRTMILLHRFIMDAQAGVMVDHVDGNGLNCCRSNMRLCGRVENGQNQRLSVRNRSGYKGVSWFSRSGKWLATIGVNGKLRYIGLYERAEDAARAYDAKAKELFGEFAQLNFSGVEP